MTTAVKVWDPLVRLAHWLLVLGILLAWLSKSGWGAWHERIGYFALAVIAVRVAWGFAGPGYARFSDFVRSPPHTIEYLRRVLRGDEPRHVGLACVHVGGVLFGMYRHRENLVASMFHGRKRV